jgi:hypothetical protein
MSTLVDARRCDLLLVMVRWGDRWLAGESGPPVLYRHHACGQISHVELSCSECGEPMRGYRRRRHRGSGIAPVG